MQIDLVFQSPQLERAFRHHKAAQLQPLLCGMEITRALCWAVTLGKTLLHGGQSLSAAGQLSGLLSSLILLELSQSSPPLG